jgi:pimeloyl-ACP methyl ester carboxylesterase
VTRRLAAVAGLVLALFALAPQATDHARGGPESGSACPGPGEVRLRAADGTRLVGRRFGGGTTAVVLAHQARGDLCQWVSYARRLASLGYVAFAFDFRNHGRSQQVGYARAGRLAGDVAAAIVHVRKRGARKVFLVGASMGGSAVLVAGANARRPVSGVVSVSGPAHFGGADAEAAVPRLRAPVLYLVAKDDGGGSFAADARTLYDRTASADKTIEILDGYGHGVSLVTFPGRARTVVEQFLRSH